MTTERASTGVVYGLAAYLWWGLCPVYFKAVAHVPAGEILAHRVIWSCLLLLLILARRGQLAQVAAAVRDRRLVATLVCSTLLVATNWFTFIWAVAHARLLQASLGYFITPFVNVVLGMIVLRERLRPLQAASLALALVGVVVMGMKVGGLPAVSLILAFSFGFYGLLRKRAAVSGTVGLTVETAMLAPAALGYLVWLGRGDRLVFAHASLATDSLLVAAGVVTALPLVWFANAARRLPLGTLAFLQYLAPSGQFLLAVLAYGEAFSLHEGVSFGFIWAALVLFTVDAARRAPWISGRVPRASRPG